MGPIAGGLVRRQHQNHGTRFSNGPLVSLRQASGGHPLGLDPRPKGELDTQALLCTDQEVAPARIVQWFVLRWQLEATFQEARSHLGVETQRQWSDRAIARTTPILMGLFSWIALAAHTLQERRPIIQRTAAWYAKPTPTFVDRIAQFFNLNAGG